MRSMHLKMPRKVSLPGGPGEFMKIFFKTTLLLLLTWFMPSMALASEIRLDAHKVAVGLREQFVVDVMVNSTDPLNAIEGQLEFPEAKLTVIDIRDGGSVINFWVQKPGLISPGVISFSGITPGGFSGPSNLLFSVVFEAKENGIAALTLGGIKSLRNDGQGSELVLPIRNTIIAINPGDSSTNREILVDTEPPENFNPIVESDPNLFNGNYFLVFATEDKVSGVREYRVREGTLDWFHKAESPYLLKEQSLKKDIYIKVIDKNGNERLVKLNAPNKASWLEQYGLFATLLAGLVLGLAFMKNKYKYGQNR